MWQELHTLYFHVTSTNPSLNKNLSLVVVVLKAVSTIQVHTSTCNYYIQYIPLCRILYVIHCSFSHLQLRGSCHQVHTMGPQRQSL